MDGIHPPTSVRHREQRLSWCRECVNARSRERYAADPERREAVRAAAARARSQR